MLSQPQHSSHPTIPPPSLSLHLPLFPSLPPSLSLSLSVLFLSLSLCSLYLSLSVLSLPLCSLLPSLPLSSLVLSSVCVAVLQLNSIQRSAALAVRGRLLDA